MKVAVIADDRLKEELRQQGLQPGADIEWLNELPLVSSSFNVIIDLHYDTERAKRKEILMRSNAAIIIVNDIVQTTENLPANFVRINAWPGFLKSKIVEACANNDAIQPAAEKLFDFFGKKIVWLPDIPGFITARVVSTIINEAYFSLEDEVSTREQIDTAMKLGTNYPYGPFEWCRLIGSKRIYSLLTRLSVDNSRYIPANTLKQEATS